MIAHGTEATTIAAGQRIVRWHAGWAAGASILPLPFVDMAGVMAVQVSMVRRLARLHGSRMDGARARTLVLSALGGAAAPTVTASGIPSMLKAVPGIGTVLGGVAAPATAMATTVALGNFFNHRFAEGHAAAVPAGSGPRPTSQPRSQPTPQPTTTASVPSGTPLAEVPQPASLAPDTLPPDMPVAAVGPRAARPPRKRRAKASVDPAALDGDPAAAPQATEGGKARPRRTRGRAARKPAGDQPAKEAPE